MHRDEPAPRHAPPTEGVGSGPSLMERLVAVAQELSTARDLPSVMAVVRTAARDLTGADGATFVLRDGGSCFYAEENAISPLWKGRRFPLNQCISGWVMQHREPAVIEDIYEDPRIPKDAYRPTFVKSLAMVPIRTSAPVGAIGNYWASRHAASKEQLKLLTALADLTSVAMENVQLYEALQRQVRETREAVKARDEFLSVAAHELRTPLTALLLQLHVLASAQGANKESGGQPEGRAYRAFASAQKLATLVEELLDAAELDARGPLQLNLQPFDFVDAAKDAVASVADAAANASCTLVLEAPESVPGRWDRQRVGQVLVSLLSNAILYGAGRPVRLKVHRVDDRVRASVCDEGPQISPEVAGTMFQRLGRAESVANYGGLGLGLYLARAVVEAHGGVISVDAGSATGCTLTFELPCDG